ncbi:Uncharacterised protein [Streptococcus pneumoniae]|nr:Uncharacterised protein [Streptococcus pneumoniae]
MCTDVACFFPGLIEEKDWSYLVKSLILDEVPLKLTIFVPLKVTFPYFTAFLKLLFSKNDPSLLT